MWRGRNVRKKQSKMKDVKASNCSNSSSVILHETTGYLLKYFMVSWKCISAGQEGFRMTSLGTVINPMLKSYFLKFPSWNFTPFTFASFNEDICIVINSFQCWLNWCGKVHYWATNDLILSTLWWVFTVWSYLNWFCLTQCQKATGY